MNQAYQFGAAELRPDQRRLLMNGEDSRIGARAFDLLLALVERRDRVVAKSELLDLVWPGLVVEENNLQVHISSLRKVLGPQAIATIPGRGYRFTAAPLNGQAAAPAAAPAPAAQARTNLPETLPPLIGRDDELAALGALLAEHRLLTLVGAGGIGKTLLAQHLLDRRRDAHAHGVAWVELAAVNGPSQVAPAIAAALGVRLPGGEGYDGLAAVLAPLDVLVALDNAEHLVDEVARVAQALLEHAPQVRLLVTSQAPLKLKRERLYRLGALAVPDTDDLPPAEALAYGAVALFVERAQAAGRGFTLDAANCAGVIDIVRRLDGMALAIELAAAREPLLGVPRLGRALDERLRLLTAGARGAPARQQTLRATLEWSHALLGAAEQAVFRRLAVVIGSGSLELVQRVASDDTLDAWAVIDALGVLADRSLVALVAAGDEHAPPRYRLLESARVFALDRLQAAGEHDALRERHARAMAELLDQAYQAFFRGRDVDALTRELEPDLDNARAAFAWGCAQDATVAAQVAAPLLRVLGAFPHESAALCDAIEPLLTDALPARQRAQVRLQGACRLSASGHMQRALDWAHESAALWRSLGDPLGHYYALVDFVWVTAANLGPTAEVADALAQLHALDAPDLPPRVAWGGAFARMVYAQAQGRFDEALPHARRCVELDEAVGDDNSLSITNLADAELSAGRADDALAHGLQALAQLRGTRTAGRLINARNIVVAAALATGDAAAARAMAVEAWPPARALGLHGTLADHLVLLAALEGRPRAAAQLAGWADADMGARQDVRQVNEARAIERGLALARTALGDAEVDRLRAEGATLTAEQVSALAFAAADGPP